MTPPQRSSQFRNTNARPHGGFGVFRRKDRRNSPSPRKREAGRDRFDRLRRTAVGVAVVALAALATGCGERVEKIGASGDLAPFTLLLDYFPNADHAPIYAARAGGYFEDEGLDVEVRAPADPAAPIKQVAAGRVDLAVSYEPEVLRARDEDLPVVAVGALVQQPLTSIISLPDAAIDGPEDLIGKRIGTAGIDYQDAYLTAILAQGGLLAGDVESINVGFNLVPALLTGRVDAILGGFWNYEGIDLRLRGRDPQIIRVDDSGVPTYNELVLVANEDVVADQPDALRAFIAALARGTADIERDQAAAVNDLLEANPDLDRELQSASVKATAPLFAAPEGRPYGWQDPGEHSAFARFMLQSDLITNEADDGWYTNDLLPGEGLSG